MQIRTRWMLALVAAFTATTLVAQDADGGNEPQEQFGDVVVVTASRTEQALNDAPAAVTVLDQKTLEGIPADDMGDILRNVPGLNVTQTGARDINMTARGSTNTLATSQLVLVDGRSLYLDFFGFVMWDFLPTNPLEIKQIEVVRGPGSAVWGANAMTGVVNVITKRPREIIGTSVNLAAGELGHKAASLTHAGISNNFGYKLSAGFYEQDAYDRPASLGNTFVNEGTKQPKGEVRLDWDLTESSYLSIGGGLARTDGIIHTGIGPFDIDSGTELSYAKIDYNKNAFRIGGFWNRLSADSENLLSRGVDGNFLPFAFQSDTYNVDIGNTSVLGTSHILTYGANARQSDFELEIAPLGTSKDEFGVFLQDEILIGDKVRWLIGGRYDDVDPIDPVFTPRTSLLISPKPGQTLRFSYNEAFRSPSVINTFLDATILVQLGTTQVFLPGHAVGNADLVEEHLTAYEVGYVGSFRNGVTVTVAAYENETEDTIDFYTSRTWGPGNLPIGIVPAQLVPCFSIAPTSTAFLASLPFPNNLLAGCPGPVSGLSGLGGLVPSDFSYRNIGVQTDRGVEFSIQRQFRNDWSWFFNASWQDDAEFEGIADADTSQNKAPEWRANVGFNYDRRPTGPTSRSRPARPTPSRW